MDNMMPYCMTNTNKDIIDMDTLAPIRRISESSLGGTSGYNSTTSPGPGNSPQSSGYSPVQSPASVLNAEFSNLVLPPEQNSNLNYVQLQNVPQQQLNLNNTLYTQQQSQQNINFSPAMNFGNPLNYQFPQIPQQQQPLQQLPTAANNMSYPEVKYEYEATLRITEQPVEKFRFRYKSEMHGTHGSLNGQTSQRNTKTFPEVELVGYKGPAIIRCSLFQTNLESPHSHQLVVRKDDHDICDPHELKVSPEVGFFAEFKNMGIIHTAKKFIVEELLKKKRKRLGREVLTKKEEQELYKQTEKEAKDMNLNQVRLCFEAFRVEENNSYTPIAAPVYSNPINNRKSAQTGELRIARLSIATGNVAGGDDLILLVEKVSKKNIKVRFYEMVDDEQVWEAFATFRESDVHHQYAIVCRTPAYRDKNIDKNVDVFIELVRPSDDERSYPPVTFRYKPSNAVISRKRRRTCSSFNSSSASNSGSLSSGDIPKTVQEQQDQQRSIGITSEELNKLINYPENGKSENMSGIDLSYFDKDLENDELDKLLHNETFGNMDTFAAAGANRIERDGISISNNDDKKFHHYKKAMICKKQMDIARQQPQLINNYINRILNIYQGIKNSKTPPNLTIFKSAAEQISKIINEYSDKSLEPLIHEIVMGENNKYTIAILKILDYFKLHDLLNTVVTTKRSQTVLHYLCLHGQPNYIRPLLKMGCNPDLQDSEGNTALHIAVLENHLNCLESFINSNMSLKINELNDDGFTALHLAIRDNKYDFVEKLLKYDNTTLTTKCQKDGSNALHMAVQQQNLKLVNLILNSCSSSLLYAVLYSKNRSGYTPLDLAKQHVTSDEQAKQILSHLLSVYNKYPSEQKMDVNNEHNDDDEDDEDNDKLVIKEEENSCSSTEDDDEDGSSSVICETQTVNTTSNLKPETDVNMTNIQTIKQEYNEDDLEEASANDRELTINDLELALNNKDIYKKLCNILNENNNWKNLANDLNMSLTCLRNAEIFINSLRRKLSTINCLQLTRALEKIDKNLIDLLKNK